MILGIDEVGRGAWAGPLVVGAVVFDQASSVKGLHDSKKLTARQREQLTRIIKSEALSIGIGWVDAAQVDRIGLSNSLRLASERAFAQIPEPIRQQLERIVIDGTIPLLDDPRVITMIKADDKVKAVSAASIIAKVARDHYMARLDRVFPNYDFSHHVGYGTASHLQKLEKFGVIPGIHRHSFAPIAKLAGQNLPEKPDRISDTIGRQAEDVAAHYLEQLGHSIINRNWRTKLCEIDLISTDRHSLYFTEVKYRRSVIRGDGIAAITPIKVKQMKFAAELFLAKNGHVFKDYDIMLSAISVTGSPPIVQDYLENILDYS